MRPFLALAEGLVQAGHDVTLAALDKTGQDSSRFAEKGGFRLIPIPQAGPPSEIEADREWRRLLSAGPLRQLELIYQAFDLDAEATLAAAQALCAENDVVLGHFMVHQLRAVAEKRGIPLATLVPIHTALPTAENGPFGLPDLGAWSHKPAWSLARFAIGRVVLPRVNSLRRRLGLAPDRDVLGQSWVSDRLNLITASPSLCPPPADWGRQHVMCGFVDRGVEPGLEPVPAEIEAFLAAGPPPVYLTFGSMMSLSEPYCRETAILLRDAVRLAGVRAIVQIPDAEFSSDSECLVVGRSPYAQVFPRCSLVVHHGGAGTTQTALRAGVPALIVAHIADQFFWGAHLAKLGAAAPPLKRKGLTARKLAEAIRRAVTMPGTRAAELGRAIAAEDGVKVAVEAIGRLKP